LKRSTKKLFKVTELDDIKILTQVSALNTELVHEFIKSNRVDKLCDIITNLSLQNFRLKNRTMRKSITLQESISAARDLNFKLYEYSARGKGGEYVD
jgi:hypothetical protein